jgi:nucleoside-diphosphate-sugar epimerase
MILLTGGSGFIGTYIVEELLANGYEKIRLLVRSKAHSPYRTHPQIELIEGDICDVFAIEEAMEGVKQVIHAAAKVSFSKREKAEMFRTNVEGTAYIVNACLAHHVEKLIFISSISALGRAENGERIDEQTKWVDSPLNSAYALSKRKAEQEVFRGMEEGLQVVILNPGLVLGGKMWDNSSAKFFKVVDRGLPFYNRGVNGVVGASDVARAVRLCVENEIPNGERFLLVSENMSQKEMFGWIAQSIGKVPPRYELPPFLAKIAGFLFEMWGGITRTRPLITRETVRSSLHQYYYDGTKITRVLGFQYSPVAEIIQATGKLFTEEKKQGVLGGK